jgi:uncharacterized membrane protein
MELSFRRYFAGWQTTDVRRGITAPSASDVSTVVKQDSRAYPVASLTQHHAGLLVLLAALIAFASKIVIAWNTFGTNDVISFYQFAVFLHCHGLQWTYSHQIAFNHPPLVAYFLVGIYRLSQIPLVEQNGVSFPFLLRLPGIVADLVTVWILFRMVKLANPATPAWSVILFALSPVSLMISGFHGNTDSIMVMFLVLAAFACVSEQPILSGLFLGLSCQVKIIPVLLIPVFFFYWLDRKAALRFVGSTAFISVALWAEPLLGFPVPFVKNVFSYGSFWGLWGFTYWLRLTGWSEFARVTYLHFSVAQTIVATVLKTLIIAAVLLLAWRRRQGHSRQLVRSLGYVWLIFFVFSPGVCAQYLVWISPFILFLSHRFFAWFTFTSSVFLFFFYNAIADKFPWYIGISHGGHNGEWVPWSVWPWGTLIAGLVIFWCRAKRCDSSLKLISLEPLTG